MKNVLKENPTRMLLLTLILFAASLTFAAAPVMAQQTVELPQRVIEAKQTDYAYTQNPGTPQVIQIKSANQSVATAGAYGVGGVQIVAVNPGKTMVEFFDNDARVLYRLPVWVTAPNPTGAGNSGYDPQRIQLDQVVMGRNRTWPVTVPGGGVPQISGVTSSNPRVATARTNTVNTIQIYSYVNGDTFINLTDSATNRNFQVHVYVRDNAPGPVGGPAGGPVRPNRATAGPNGDGKIDLPQIIMLIGQTQNVSTQNSGRSQIANLDSTNTGVATASGIGSNSIQIYARALGDTWVTFLDAATRTTYRVHVWVIKPGGPMPPPDPGPKANPEPGPKGKFDPLLVGRWQAEVHLIPGAGHRTAPAKGAIVTIKADGTQTVDYSNMESIVFDGDQREAFSFRGTAMGRISTSANMASVVSMEQRNVLHTYSSPVLPRPLTTRFPNFGPAGLGSDTGKHDEAYSCTEDTIEFRTDVGLEKGAYYQVKLTRIK